jgi:hypothetical protein
MRFINGALPPRQHRTPEAREVTGFLIKDKRKINSRPERLRLRPSSCPLTWSFSARLYDFEQAYARPAVTWRTAATRCAEVPVRLRTGRATPKWLVRALPADCGAGAHDATPQENSGQVSKSPGPRSPSLNLMMLGGYGAEPVLAGGVAGGHASRGKVAIARCVCSLLPVTVSTGASGPAALRSKCQSLAQTQPTDRDQGRAGHAIARRPIVRQVY